MSLRIISGERRGTRIEAPPGQETRPLRDRLRESLFNILRPEIRGAVVLDAFAGSGAAGLEALSNGARHATMVELSPAAIAVIRANVGKLRYQDRSAVIEGPSPEAALRASAPAPYHLILLMPPYHTNLCPAVLGHQPLLERCAPGALAVCEIHRDEAPPISPRWILEKERTYGITRLLFLRHVNAQ